MASKVSEVMTPHPVTLDFSAPLTDAAEAMRQKDIGTVLVNKDGAVYGILTDRDLVVRGLVDGENPSMTPVGDVCSREVNALRPSSTIDQAVKLMREKFVRRAPVIENGEAVGIVSIGDLAQDRDERSTLAAISSAPANR